MKKLSIGVAASAMLASGLVAGASGPAQATECDYNGCEPTVTKIIDKQGDRVTNKGTSPAFIVRTRVDGGDGTPNGRIRVTFTHLKSGQTKKGLTTTEAYEGGKEKIRPDGKLRKVGKWIVTAKFRSPNGDFFGSADSTTMNVVRG